MLKTPEEEAGLTPIEKELNRSFGFVHNLAAAAALGLILERLAEAELAIDLYGDDEDHALMIPIVEKDKAELEAALIDLANLKEAAGISA